MGEDLVHGVNELRMVEECPPVVGGRYRHRTVSLYAADDFGKLGGGWAQSNAMVNVPGSSWSGSGVNTGWLIGGGIEYGFKPNWTVKLEYNYIVFGARSFATTSCSSSTGSPTTCIGNGQSSGNTPLSADKQLFKFGVNYKFDWGAAPVIAKY